jgi:hypothetical protein
MLAYVLSQNHQAPAYPFAGQPKKDTGASAIAGLPNFLLTLMSGGAAAAMNPLALFSQKPAMMMPQQASFGQADGGLLQQLLGGALSPFQPMTSQAQMGSAPSAPHQPCSPIGASTNES